MEVTANNNEKERNVGMDTMKCVSNEQRQAVHTMWRGVVKGAWKFETPPLRAIFVSFLSFFCAGDQQREDIFPVEFLTWEMITNVDDNES